MAKKSTIKTPQKLTDRYPSTPTGKKDVIIVSLHPHEPIDMIYFKIEKKDLRCIACGADVEDQVEHWRKKLKKCLI